MYIRIFDFQIHSEIDELHQHLQARRGSYGNSLPAARMNSQAFKQFEMTVEVGLNVLKIKNEYGWILKTEQIFEFLYFYNLY